MRTHDLIYQISRSSPNEVWVVLMKNGNEYVTKLRTEANGLSVQVFLERPMQVRHAHIVRQNQQDGSIRIQTQPQMQPVCFFGTKQDLPVEEDDVWTISSASKLASDSYIEYTTGILTS